MARLADLQDAVVELLRTTDVVCGLASSTQQACSSDAAGASPTGASRGSSASSSRLQASDHVKQLLEDKERIQRDRDKLASEQGLHKGRIAQLEGSVAANEKRVRLLLDELSTAKEQCESLRSQLQEAKLALDVTPVRCRTAARQLQDEADRAWGRARTQEAQVKKLRQLVQHEAQEMTELVEFTEAERKMLVEQQRSLEEQLQQALKRVEDREMRLEQLQQDLDSSRSTACSLTQQLEQAGTDRQVLEQQLSTAQQALAQAQAAQEAAQSQQQAAAAEARRAQQEAAAAQEQFKCIFRQVRFTSHVLDKNAALLGKIPELQGLARELRALVASNPTTAPAGATLGGGGGGGAAGSAGGLGGPDQGSGAGLGGAEDCRGPGGAGAAVVGLDRCGAGPSAGQDVSSFALRSRPAIS